MTLSRKERERLTRESEVLSAAEKLFTRKGYENTTMDEIAKEAEFTKRTLYQYFISKENLFYAVIINGVKQLISYVEEEMAAGKTGLGKIQGMRAASYRFVKEFPDIYRLMNYTQYIKSDPQKIPNYHEMTKLNSRLFSCFHQVIDEGLKDGSIRPDFNAALGIPSMFFLITGFMNRVSEAGDTYSKRFEIDIEELVKYAFDMMDIFMKAHDPA